MQQTYLGISCSNTACPLYVTCSKPVTTIRAPNYKDDGKIDILLIADHADKDAFVSRIPFSGMLTLIINELMEANPDKTIATAFMVRGWPVDEETIPPECRGQLSEANQRSLYPVRSVSFSAHAKKREIVNCCLPHLEKDILELKPGLIICLGNNVVEFLFPRNSESITNLYAKEMTLYGIPTKFASSPMMLSKNPSLKTTWLEHVNRLISGRVVEYEERKIKTELIMDLGGLIKAVDHLKSSPMVAFDVETKNLCSRWGNKLGTIQFSPSSDLAYVIPFDHPETPFLGPDRDFVIETLQDLLSNQSDIKMWVSHGGKFDLNQLANETGVMLSSAPIFDTQTGAFLLDENRAERRAEFKYGIYSLKQLARDYLKFDGYDKDVLKNRNEGNLMDLALTDLAEYGGMDTAITYALAKAEMVEATKQNYYENFMKLQLYFYSMVLQLFSDIERNGCYVNRQYLRSLIRRDSPIRTAIEEANNALRTKPEVQEANRRLVYEGYSKNNINVTPLGGTPWVFDFAKTGHPQKLFFEVMGLAPIVLNTTGGSVDDDWQKANAGNAIVDAFADYVQYKKMYDSFVTKLYARVDPSGKDENCRTDSRIRPDYKVSTVVTGRIACSNPNLQGIPRADSPAKKAVKNIFQAPAGYAMVQFDYKAAEMRWVTVVSQDPGLADKFNQGKKYMDAYREDPSPDKLRLAEIYGDIHRQNASTAYEKPIEEVTKNERQGAKGITFGVLYDSSPKGIAETYNLTLDQATTMINTFYEKHPNVYDWKLAQKHDAMYKGYVEAPHGRRRRFPIWNLIRDYYPSTNLDNMRQTLPQDLAKQAADALRQSSNAPIQGISSDGAMIGAALFAKYIRENNLDWKIQNAVHDSMVYLVPIEEVPTSLELAEHYLTTGITDHMHKVWGIDFPITIEVDAEIGLKWGELISWNFDKNHLSKIMDGLRAGDMSLAKE